MPPYAARPCRTSGNPCAHAEPWPGAPRTYRSKPRPLIEGSVGQPLVRLSFEERKMVKKNSFGDTVEREARRIKSGSSLLNHSRTWVEKIRRVPSRTGKAQVPALCIAAGTGGNRFRATLAAPDVNPARAIVLCGTPGCDWRVEW